MPIDSRIISEELPAELGDEAKRPTLLKKPVLISVDGIEFSLRDDGRYMSQGGEEHRSPIKALVDFYNSRVPTLH